MVNLKGKSLHQLQQEATRWREIIGTVYDSRKTTDDTYIPSGVRT